MTDILVPTARVVDIVVCQDQVPWDLTGEVSGVLRGRAQVQEFAAAVGRAKMPKRPLMLYGADEYMPILIVGDGVTEAAEMQDLAEEQLGRMEENVKKYGRGFDFDEARERNGMARREDFGRLMADAYAERAEYLRTHRRTDPLGKGDR